MKKSKASCIMNLPKVVTTTAFLMALVVFVFYYNMLNLIKFYSLDKTSYETSTTLRIYNDVDEFMLDTEGCVIPNFSKNLKFKEATYQKKTCGHRAIFVNKISQDKIIFEIRNMSMKQYSKGKHFDCCFKFAYRSTESEKEDTDLTYSKCKGFQNGTIIQLEHEVITVTCSTNSGTHQKVIYQDAYLIIKKINIFENKKESGKTAWNVLLVGMDTMSRARVYNTMPYTVSYLQKHKWLDFKGYQKVGYNTFPNIISFLTGKKMSTIYKACSKGMIFCNELLIWSKFNEAGYVTAYGEEYLDLPDTFTRYKGFKTPPTNHYARPFYLTGEEKRGNYICTEKRPSALHLLDYAVDFTNAYQNENFFGMFWLNSFSHNFNNMPALIDSDMMRFFEKLEKANVLNNTFVVFLSDHGIRYGEMRLPIESYYEERLPMFFMHVPFAFQEIYLKEYNNLKINQHRLSTPYDLHLTMWNILKLSNDSIDVLPSEACANCSSLFYEKSTSRTCADAGVTDKWCSCHSMNKADGNEAHVQRSLEIAVSYIQNKTQTIETTECMECERLTLKKILRHHFYIDGIKIFYIVAFLLAPGDVAFEANLVRNGDDISIIQPTETISAYNTRGNCVKNPNDRSYCVCKENKDCNKKRNRYVYFLFLLRHLFIVNTKVIY